GAEEILLTGGDIEELHHFNGRTLLLEMERKNQPEAVQWLLDHGADPLMIDNHEMNLWDMKFHKLIERIKPDDYAKFPELADQLLANGAEINQEDGHGYTPLHIAVMHGSNYMKSAYDDEFTSYSNEIVEYLIEHGADVNAQSNEVNANSTPLHVACKVGDASKVMVLLDAGADISIQDAEGKTASEQATDSFEITNISRYEQIANLIESFVEKQELEKRLSSKDETKQGKKQKI
ncbi:MAG TPA: ankyrin repeat domain-containing protein, partial [Anaerovoracaceae bacterium]|nr:ankyrin repeat domain-containing protein [Anaerovoracaceae bacterium]